MMSINTRTFLATLLLLLGAASCDKMPDNGDIDGFWQLTTVVRGDTATSVKGSKLYWSIRANLVQLNGAPGGRKYAHFTRQGSQLTLYDLCHDSRNATEADDNEWITAADIGCLLPYGITPEPDTGRPGRLTQTFTIETLSPDAMVLATSGGRLRFRKF